MTTTEDTRVRIDERYSVAIGASNLRVGEQSSQADVILAAGLQRNRLGSLLMRLQAEYDAVRSEIVLAEHNRRAREAELAALERSTGKAVKRGEHTAEDGAYLVQAARDETDKITQADHLMILSQLKTLREAKEAIGAHAIVMATRHRFMRDNGVVLKIAGRVIDVWLRPACNPCNGTGWKATGYAGEAPRQCSACKGTGHRRDTITNAQEQWFAFLLLGDLQREMAAAGGAMVRKLRKE